MKQLACEMCGSNDLLKKDGVFVCQTCGTKYSVEEAKKLMIEGPVEVSGTVKVDQSHLMENFLNMAISAVESGNNSEAEQYCNKVLEIDPRNYKAFLYKGTATGWQSTFAKLRMAESVNCWRQALENCDKDTRTAVRAYTDAEFRKIIIAMVTLAGSFVEDGVNEYNGAAYREHLIAILDCIKLYARSVNVAFPLEKTCSEAAIAVVPSLMKCADAEVRLYHKIKPSSGGSYEDFIKEFMFCIDLLTMTATFGQEDEAKALCYEKAADVMQTINTLPFYIWDDGDYRPRTNSGNHYGSEVAKYRRMAAEARDKFVKQQGEKKRNEFWAANSDEYKFLNGELKKSKTERNKLDKAKTGYSKIVLLDEHISKIEAILTKDRTSSSKIEKSEKDFIKNCDAFWFNLSSDSSYDAYLDQHPILKKANEYTNKRAELIVQKEEIDKRKSNYNRGILFRALFVLSIIFAGVGVVVPALFNHDLLFLGVVMGVVGVLSTMFTGAEASSYSKFTSAQGVGKTKALEQKYRSELILYNKVIDEMNAVPKFTGSVNPSVEVCIPDKLSEHDSISNQPATYGSANISVMKSSESTSPASEKKTMSEEMAGWSDIEKIYTDDTAHAVVGLKSDGSLVFPKQCTLYTSTLQKVTQWADIIQLEHGSLGWYGLTRSGRVFFEADSYGVEDDDRHGQDRVGHLTDIKKILGEYGGRLMCIKNNGSLVATEFINGTDESRWNEISNWTNIDSISFDVPGRIVGIKLNGSLVATSYVNDDDSYSNGGDDKWDEMSTWKDVVKVTLCGYERVVALDSSGRLLATSQFEPDEDNETHYDPWEKISSWKDLVDFHDEGDYAIGLKRDGCLVSAKWFAESDNEDCDYGQWNVSNLKSVKCFVATFARTFVVKEDGTVELAGEFE